MCVLLRTRRKEGRKEGSQIGRKQREGRQEGGRQTLITSELLSIPNLILLPTVGQERCEAQRSSNLLKATQPPRSGVSVLVATHKVGIQILGALLSFPRLRMVKLVTLLST